MWDKFCKLIGYLLFIIIGICAIPLLICLIIISLIVSRFVDFDGLDSDCGMEHIPDCIDVDDTK